MSSTIKNESDLTLEQYKLLWEKLNQEGDGIWSRFNIMTGITVALFTGFGILILQEKQTHNIYIFTVGICFLGMLNSIWSYQTLERLWSWHRYWKDCLIEIEKAFSAKQLKPHSKQPDLGSRLIPNSWFFLITFIVWILLLLTVWRSCVQKIIK